MNKTYGSYDIRDSASNSSQIDQESEKNQVHSATSKCHFIITQLQKWVSLISVEPTMFFYMIAFMLTTVVEQAFYVYKACIANHGYSVEICTDLDNPIYKDFKTDVQVTVSNFHQWNGIAGHTFPIILAFFMGAWSDKRGRKVLMLSGLIGNFWWSILTVVNTVQTSWPVEYMIYTATLPSSITGTNVAIFAGCFSYLADITTSEDRTLRIGILDVIYLSTMPIGIYLGSVLFTLFNKSYTIMFSINATCLFVAIIYTLFNLKWQTNAAQISFKDAGVTNPIKDFIDMNHLIQSKETLFKKRIGKRRMFVWLLLLAMALYAFQRDEKPMLYLYTNKIFGWDVSSFSIFKTYYSTFFIFMMLLGIPIMSKVLKWRDTTIVMIGAASHAVGRIFFASANKIFMMYIGASAASLGPCVAPVIRSMASKAVNAEEKGKVYAILSVCDNAITIISATMYTQIFNNTISTDYPYTVFLLTIATQLVVLLCGLIIHIKLHGEPMDKYNVSDQKTENSDGI